MLVAYSFCTGICIEDLVQLLGHDGSEIIFPERPAPYNQRSFTVPEFSLALYPLGWTSTHLYEVDLSQFICGKNKYQYNYVAHNNTHCFGSKFGEIHGYTCNIEGIILLDQKYN